MEKDEGQNQNADQDQSKAEGQPDISLEDLQKQVNKLSSQNERLLNESKDWAGKYRSLRGKVEGEEKQKLEESENWKELLEREKQEKFELSENLKGLKEKSLRQSLNFEVAKHATDAHKLERVIGAVLDSDAVNISDDGVSFSGISEAIESLRNDEPYLFKQEKPAGMVNSNPSGKAPKNKTLDEMSKGEKELLFKESIKSMIGAKN